MSLIMTVRASALISMVAFLALCAGSADAASFNCRLQLPSDMRAICNDPGLSARDDRAAALYNRLSNSMGPTGQAALRAQRLGFLRERGACRGDRGCMKRAYDEQIATLRSMAPQSPPPAMATTRPGY
jgi:uncharacterized protein